MEDRSSVLSLNNVSLSYRSGTGGIQNVSLEVCSREIVGLVGPNGSGKSTTFKVILGFLKNCQGDVCLNGESLCRYSIEERVQRGIGYLGQEISLFLDLTVYENLWLFLEYNNELSHLKKKERLYRSLEMMQIQDLSDRKAFQLSGGEKRRLEIARVLLRDPIVIIFDEPFAGVDPVSIKNIQEMVVQLSQQGISILISDHNVREVCRLIDRMYVIIKGRIIACGDIETLKNNEQVSYMYFGRTFDDI